MATANQQSSRSQQWYDQHYWALLLALASFVVAYLIGSRSLDTGSWQQYGLTLVFLIFGINRLGRAAHTATKTLWAMLPKKHR